MVVFKCNLFSGHPVIGVMIDRGLVDGQYTSDFWFGEKVIISKVKEGTKVAQRQLADKLILNIAGYTWPEDLVSVETPPWA